MEKLIGYSLECNDFNASATNMSTIGKMHC